MTKVYVKDCDSYSQTDNAVFSILGSINPKIKKNAKILIKPNLLMAANPDLAVTTHPQVVESVVKWIKKNHPDASISIGDSSGLFGLSATKSALKESGMERIARQYHLHLIAFDADKLIEVKSRNAKIWKKLLLPKTVVDADLIINMPKLKAHALTIFSGSVKNIYGCIPGRKKAIGHVNGANMNNFANILLDIYEAVNPGITIMDAVIGLEGRGPGTGGDPVKIGYILGSESGIAVDSVALKIAGINEEIILSQRWAMARKIYPDIEVAGHYKVKKIKIAQSKYLRFFSNLPMFLGVFSRIMTHLFFLQSLNYPEIDKKLCTRCLDCRKACPVCAIAVKNKYPYINYRACIKCMCCLEHCRFKAIFKRKPVIAGLYSNVKKAIGGKHGKHKKS